MRVDPNYITNLTVSLDQSTNEEDTLTSELSSGLRVASLSDDPVAAEQSMLLGSSIAQDDTFVQTASDEASRMQVADSTLGEVVSAGDQCDFDGRLGQQWDGQCERCCQRCSNVERRFAIRCFPWRILATRGSICLAVATVQLLLSLLIRRPIRRR